MVAFIYYTLSNEESPLNWKNQSIRVFVQIKHIESIISSNIINSILSYIDLLH